jgi:hypothetical protein
LGARQSRPLGTEPLRWKASEGFIHDLFIPGSLA